MALSAVALPFFHLPQELVDAVVQEIPTEDRDTLQKCTLVSYSFYSCAHRRLFSSITLQSSSYSHQRQQFDPYSRFLRYILRTSRDALLVKHLRLHDHRLTGQDSWLTSDEIMVPSILSLLPNLSSLAFHGLGLDTCPSPRTLCTVKRLLSSATLSSIAFHRVTFQHYTHSLLGLFSASNGPKDITISGGLTYFCPADALTGTPANTRPVSALALNMVPEAAQDLVACLRGPRSPLNLSTLQSLSLWMTWKPHIGIYNALLRDVADTLQELEIHASNTGVHFREH